MLIQPLLDYQDSVVIADYGMSNLFSVVNTLQALGCKATVSRCPEEILAADRVILPGVGAFGAGMHNLRQLGIADALLEAAALQKPLLGICLGMQLLASEGFEHGHHAGLDLIPGRVEKLPSEAGLRIPHVGWNEVHFCKEAPLYEGLGASADYYFVHSFHFSASSEEMVTGWCNYGQRFAASVQLGTVMGVQFHPEKSQLAGLSAIKNFLTYSPC